MTILETTLLGYLIKYCRGRTAARTQARIAGDLASASGLDVRPRDVRDALGALALAGRPVGTSTRGAFWCVDAGDFAAATRHLTHRLDRQGQRARRLQTTARESLSGQGTFELTLEDPAGDVEFEERAAIREFDGGLPRAEAEALARADLEQRRAACGSP